VTVQRDACSVIGFTAVDLCLLCQQGMLRIYFKNALGKCMYCFRVYLSSVVLENVLNIIKGLSPRYHFKLGHKHSFHIVTNLLFTAHLTTYVISSELLTLLSINSNKKTLVFSETACITDCYMTKY
jgi:hypothetical protein